MSWKCLKLKIWGSHQTLWSLPLPNVTWHSGTWPYTRASSIDLTLHQFANLLPSWTLLPILTVLPNFGGFHSTLQRVRLEDAYSSGHLVLSHLGLAFVLLLRPFFPELVMSTDILNFQHPLVLLLCSSPEPLDGFWWNLVGMKYPSWSLTSVVVFRPDPPRGGSRTGQNRSRGSPSSRIFFFRPEGYSNKLNA